MNGQDHMKYYLLLQRQLRVMMNTLHGVCSVIRKDLSEEILDPLKI